jgi:hypothetical protein
LLHDAYSGYPYEIVTVTPAAHVCEPTVAEGTAPPVVVAQPELRLPDGISAPYSGIYPSRPNGCCFLAARASFSIALPPGASGLRFAVYAPKFARLAPQRLTILIDGTTARRSPVLTEGQLTWIDATLPAGSRGRGAVNVAIVPSSSFVPKNLGISTDTRTVSVVLIRVETTGSAGASAGMQLPEGVVPAAADAARGIYPGSAGQCCFLGASAAFLARVAPAAHTLRFVVYTPDFAGDGQQLTITVAGRVTRRSGILRKGMLTAIEVPLPATSRGRSAVPVVIAPRFSFVPQALGVSTDTRRISVVLLRVTSY